MTVDKGKDLTASLEDYLEAIFNLAGRASVARSKDIAQMLGVSKPSVTEALQVLKKKGLANYKPYGSVTLTESGRAAGAEIARRHTILKSFFVSVLGVDGDMAQEAACKAEHALGPGIIGRLLCFVEFVGETDRDGYNVTRRFKRYYKGRTKTVRSRE